MIKYILKKPYHKGMTCKWSCKNIKKKKELIKKKYGGAVRNRVNTHELYVSQLKGKNVEEKKKIAKKAFELIE